MPLPPAWLIASLFAAGATGADALPPPHVALQADFNDLISREGGTLEVDVRADILGDRIEPLIGVSYKREHPCPPPDREACATVDELGICADHREQYLDFCGSTTYSRSYTQVDELIAALDEAISHGGAAAPHRADFGCAPSPCNPPATCEGSVASASTRGAVEFTLKSSGPIALDAEAAAGFVATLRQARDLVAHLRPKVEAFNRAAPDPRVPMDLDWLRWTGEHPVPPSDEPTDF